MLAGGGEARLHQLEERLPIVHVHGDAVADVQAEESGPHLGWRTEGGGRHLQQDPRIGVVLSLHAEEGHAPRPGRHVAGHLRLQGD